MNKNITILWLRHDLRLVDNPALLWAAQRGAVIPLYIYDDGDDWRIGGASQWWLHYALDSLHKNYAPLGVSLVLRRGNPLDVLQDIIASTGANAVVWTRCYEPYAVARDKDIKSRLQAQGIEVATHNGALLFEPWDIQTLGGTPYKVFTPFAKACRAAKTPLQPLSAPKQLDSVSGIASESLAAWRLLPTKPDWAKDFHNQWDVTEQAAHTRLHHFVDASVMHYKESRNRPDNDQTSRLSPYLHWGLISVRHVWHAVQNVLATVPELGGNAETFLNELLWREFSAHLLYHFPTLPEEPLNKKFSVFPWRTDEDGLRAWQKGMTGYPIVDAGMRQLWQTGWMHNRVRMIVASFLVKDLLISWQEGQKWFWDTLVDADLASNAASWQWVAGCGADAAPYFRVFNPVLQGQKFDPNGDYVRRYVPELSKLDASIIHEPCKALPTELATSGVVLGKNYPFPILDHGKARLRALAALAETKP